jgi:hypothetical protein
MRGFLSCELRHTFAMRLGVLVTHNKVRILSRSAAPTLVSEHPTS